MNTYVIVYYKKGSFVANVCKVSASNLKSAMKKFKMYCKKEDDVRLIAMSSIDCIFDISDLEGK